MASEEELRRSATLLCADVLLWTHPLPKAVQDVLEIMTWRLSRSTSWTVEDKSDFTSLLLEAGARFTRPA